MPNSTTIGTFPCPIDGCTEQLPIEGKPRADTEYGMLRYSIKPTPAALNHLRSHNGEHQP